jgi:hypothetical protein
VDDKSWMTFVCSVAYLFVLIGVFAFYLARLERSFFAACREQKELALFSQLPAGLPEGTVRSVLALLIVLVGLFLIVLSLVNKVEVPGAMTGILGTVLGFYFGSRTAAGAKGDELKSQVEDLKTQRDQAVQDKGATDATTLISKVQKGIALTKMVAAVLPPEQRQKYEGVAAKMEQGLAVAQTLAGSGSVAEAATKAGEVFDLFKEGNPVKEQVVKASQSFAAALGSSVPQIALIMAIVGVSATLIGVAYQKWKARILRLPFSPAVIPLSVVDAQTGFILFLQCPIFKSVFAAELEGHDRPFMEAAVKDFLREDSMEALWQTYKSRFESREQFEAGVEEFRRAAADLELKNAVDPTLLAGAGGYDTVMASIDKIQANEQARADLDALLVTVEGINEKGGSPKDVFDKVFNEVQSKDGK